MMRKLAMTAAALAIAVPVLLFVLFGLSNWWLTSVGIMGFSVGIVAILFPIINNSREIAYSPTADGYGQPIVTTGESDNSVAFGGFGGGESGGGGADGGGGDSGGGGDNA